MHILWCLYKEIKIDKIESRARATFASTLSNLILLLFCCWFSCIAWTSSVIHDRPACAQSLSLSLALFPICSLPLGPFFFCCSRFIHRYIYYSVAIWPSACLLCWSRMWESESERDKRLKVCSQHHNLFLFFCMKSLLRIMLL